MTVTLLAAAAAAGTTLLPKLSTPTHESTIHPSNLPAFTNTAKGKEKLLRPALKTKTSQNPSHNPVTSTQTRTRYPNSQPETHAQQPPQTRILTQAQTQIQTQTHNVTETHDHPKAQTRDPSTQTQTQYPKSKIQPIILNQISTKPKTLQKNHLTPQKIPLLPLLTLP